MNHIHKSKRLAVYLGLGALLLAGLACNAAAGTPTPAFSGLETMVAATLQAMPSQPSPIPTFAMPTALPTSTNVPPTAVIPPTQVIPPTPVFVPPAANRIYFSTGATQSITTGTIHAGEVVTFVAKATLGQPLIASVGSPSQGVHMSIFGANGQTLLAFSQRSAMWQGTLPSTQDYYFQLTGGSYTETFNLDVIFGARIQFATGTIKTTIKGTTVNGFSVAYVAYAQKGQKMDVILTVPGDTAALTIWGFSDGQPYARAQNGVQDFSLVLPSTQDYIISVVPKAGQEVDYSLLVRIK